MEAVLTHVITLLAHSLVPVPPVCRWILEEEVAQVISTDRIFTLPKVQLSSVFL